MIHSKFKYFIENYEYGGLFPDSARIYIYIYMWDFSTWVCPLLETMSNIFKFSHRIVDKASWGVTVIVVALNSRLHRDILLTFLKYLI